MKIGVLKLGARILWDLDNSVTSGEAISICKALRNGGAEVHVFTKILKKDTLHESLHWHQIMETDPSVLQQLDVLCVINGNVNFFGGAEDAEQIANYRLINTFTGPVVYLMCDPELPFVQIWENVEKKPWGTKYTKDEILIQKPIHLVSQPYALLAVKADWPKKGVPLGQIVHYPMDRFPLLNPWLPPAEHPTVDLMYGGTARGGRRIPNLYKWYCGLPDDISVEIFGKIDETDFEKHPKIGKLPVKRYPQFTGMVKYGDVLPKMQGALAHLVTGDPSYESLDLIPQRVAECIAAGNIVFIDANIDKSRRIYPKGTAAHEYLYVRDQAMLVDLLRLIKSSPETRQTIIEEQRLALGWDPVQFCENFVNTLSTFKWPATTPEF
jgi:hypothetical protein